MRLVPLLALLAACDYQPRPGSGGTPAPPASGAPAAVAAGGDCTLTLAVDGMT